MIDWPVVLALSIAFIELLGMMSAIHAVTTVRSSQGTIAWVVCLITFPFITLPLYWIFGRNKFYGYVEVIREALAVHREQAEELLAQMNSFGSDLGPPEKNIFASMDALSEVPATHSNYLKLLIDGEETFSAIFEAIERAQNYILLEFFIVRDDEIGNELADRLIKKVKEGVRVLFLYDEIGSKSLGRRYINKLNDGGVEFEGFKTTRGRANRFQLNFRNHRKIVIIDGDVAYVGGHNVGDEYMSRNKKIGHWRDTHVMLEGPAVDGVQIAFAENWHWATRRFPGCTWTPEASTRGNADVLSVHTGPIDQRDVNHLFFLNAICTAQHRIWITSPYFVPSDAIFNALKLAAMRGLDVRIMLPGKPDHYIVYTAAFWYLHELMAEGVKMYRYKEGFLHQKVGLFDDKWAYVGTSNLDNRSLRLNFEINVAVADDDFVHEVEKMLIADFEQCHQCPEDEYSSKSFLFRVAVNICRLFSPLL